MDSGRPFISFIVTCKGRLAHLREMLPALVGQPASEVVVVDYDCPDRAAQWVLQHHPQCVTVEATGKSTFNASDARNLGWQQAKGQWLFFVDADIVLSHDLVDRLQGQLSERHFYVLGHYRHLGAYGSVLVARQAVEKIGGWDTLFTGYGGEDYDFFRMLTYAGLSMALLKTEPVRVIPHSKEERTRFHSVSKRQSLATAKLYGTAKRDLVKIHRSVNVSARVLADLRARCEREVELAIAEGRLTTSVTILLEPERALFPEEDRRRRTVRRRLVVEIDIDP